MNRVMVFLAGLLSGALLLGLLLVGWDLQVTVAPTVTPVAGAPSPPPVQAVPAAIAPPPVVIAGADPAPALSNTQAAAGAPPAAIASADPAPPLPSASVEVAPPLPPSPGEPTEEVAAAPPPDAGDGGRVPALSLRIPVDGIAAAQLSDTFADARGADRVHDAIDIMAPTGTPVRAVADGRIVKLFDSKQGGLTIYQFDATETVSFYYAHLDRYADGVAEGQAVAQGELIGYVGYTGNASPDGPHLHFAITLLGPEKNWWQGRAINPYPYLRR
jgi:murein DD-endopeptidase MepM/ murein hydrolase activator NlpD